jgi:hypothetical protein
MEPNKRYGGPVKHGYPKEENHSTRTRWQTRTETWDNSQIGEKTTWLQGLGGLAGYVPYADTTDLIARYHVAESLSQGDV